MTYNVVSVSRSVLADGTIKVEANYTVAINASNPLALYRAQYQCICLHSFNSTNKTLPLGRQMLTFSCERVIFPDNYSFTHST